MTMISEQIHDDFKDALANLWEHRSALRRTLRLIRKTENRLKRDGAETTESDPDIQRLRGLRAEVDLRKRLIAEEEGDILQLVGAEAGSAVNRLAAALEVIRDAEQAVTRSYRAQGIFLTVLEQNQALGLPVRKSRENLGEAVELATDARTLLEKAWAALKSERGEDLVLITQRGLLDLMLSVWRES